MTEKRFTHRKWYNERQLFDGEEPFAIVDIYIQSDKICDKLNEIAEENEQLKQQLSDINGQLVMLDNCDNWDYDRMKHTVREIAEIIGYNGTINLKR